MQTGNNKNYSGIEELINTEVMKKYNHFIVASAVKNVRSTSQVIDFGAGIGTLSLIFLNKFRIRTKCVEVDAHNKKLLLNRNIKSYDRIEQVPKKVSLIFSSNVLKHIEDDFSSFLALKKKLKKNGQIYLYLPAKMSLWSSMDEKVGHYRRYELSEIRKKCEQVGLKVELLHYADSIGFFASFLMKLIGYNYENGIG